jgi:hypothetical protein
MGSSSLNAEVNAFERLQIVRDRNSSYLDCASQVLRNLKFALNERFVDDYLCRDICQFTLPPGLHLFAHGLEIPLHAVEDGDNSTCLGGKRCE